MWNSGMKGISGGKRHWPAGVAPPSHAGPGLAFAKGLSLEPPRGGRSLQLQARWRKVMTEVGSVHLAVENRQGQCLSGCQEFPGDGL